VINFIKKGIVLYRYILKICSLTEEKDLKFCLEIWGTDHAKIKDACLLAEDLGYHGFFYGESLADLDLDSWTVISALSSLTKRIKLGPVITYLLPQYRSIALVAKQAITLQEISDGRLEFRTGAGATLQYAVQWWYPYGIDYPENAKRVLMFEEGIRILEMLLGDNPSSSMSSLSSLTSSVKFSGEFFRINGATFKPPSKKIPITVAAKKNKMMHLAAKYADIWESSYLSPQQFSSLRSNFERIAQSVNNDGDKGNNNKKIANSIEFDVLIAETDRELEYKKRMIAMERGPAVFNQILNNGLVGKPDAISKRVKEYTVAGVNQFFFAFQDPFDFKALELFRESVKAGGGGAE
jgi:alkanesulfonate monooxygenase SsuD/methylene tetrahydromethanopterin reductase-like flavin-dependent oxidoreductase (luciferase family)